MNTTLKLYRDKESAEWNDWLWQQRNVVRDVAGLKRAFPGISDSVLEQIQHVIGTRRLQMTPYYTRLIETTSDGTPVPNDPMWLQVIPDWTSEPSGHADEYDGETDNWEAPEEMKTPIAQHKYDNRIIVRLSNACLSYCQFCYEALRTLEKKTSKDAFDSKNWKLTVDFVRENPAIEEVILSGGEPMLLRTEVIDNVLSDLRSIDRHVAIRLHTRTLTFNPYRIDDDLLATLKRHEPEAIGLHIAHPRELTDDFKDGVRKLGSVSPILFANIPLLGGINDDPDTMRTLCMNLYRIGVIPHYLYHFMPFAPNTNRFRTSVREGLEIVRGLKRRISNLAVPEFVLPHYSGKYTPPLLGESEGMPQWEVNETGEPVVTFTNWRGEKVSYLDAHDAQKLSK